MLPLIDLPGAVVEDGVLRHLGNPLGEQRALAHGRAVALLGDRGVIAVAGPDRLSWLDSLTSQAVAHLSPGESTEMLVLDPHGHVEHAASVLDDGETTWLIVDAADVGPLASWLTRMRFRLRVEIRDATDEVVVVGGTDAAVRGVPAAEVTGRRLAWQDPWPRVQVGGHAYGPLEQHAGEDWDWTEALVLPDDAARMLEDARRGERDLAGSLAADALRIAAWRPRWRSEADERALPHEADWLRTAVHLSKGCYRGQETVAKVHNLGHPPRRLVALHLDGSDSTLPAPGAPVRTGEDVVGAITSSALHYEEGPIALALVRRNTPIDVDLVVDTEDGAIAAAQVAIVPPEAGAVAGVPRITRLSRRKVAGA
ncbi:folate-binding protein [Microbacterium sp. ET2]|uniref:CAF17-like 4Fe-4S cluster assembly/insertion protein YgfZ n=1 Tax=Microbacterium albipurpureum TaxID=3050384 RepID=UPI00259D1A28|nr:folate-binding protein [Microbacterium sp. ET2 (Ac-2212)]WJL96197.1 folate-binding protein [Microbacterium sp. ET2 (Ac-2212)]